MKKIKLIISTILALTVLISLSACANNKESEIKDDPNKEGTSQEALSGEVAQDEEETTAEQEQAVSEPNTEKVKNTPKSEQTTSASETTTSQYIPRPITPAKLSADAEKKIIEDYFAELERIIPQDCPELSRISVENYYGTYSGGEVVYMRCPYFLYSCALRDVEVAGYVLTFMDGQPLYFHKNGEFYTIKEAYENGLITKQDVCDIKYNANLTYEG